MPRDPLSLIRNNEVDASLSIHTTHAAVIMNNYSHNVGLFFVV